MPTLASTTAHAHKHKRAEARRCRGSGADLCRELADPVLSQQRPGRRGMERRKHVGRVAARIRQDHAAAGVSPPEGRHVVHLPRGAPARSAPGGARATPRRLGGHPGRSIRWGGRLAASALSGTNPIRPPATARTRFFTTSHASSSQACRATSSSVKLPPRHQERGSGAGRHAGASAAAAAHLLNSASDPTTASSAPLTARVEDLMRPVGRRG
jgi:hypothetical protein